MERTEKDLLLDAALALAGERGWKSVTIGRAAEQAGIDTSKARRLFPCKSLLLVRFAERIDEAMLEGVDEDAKDPSLSARDRLFDVLMARFDALEQHKDTVRAIVKGAALDPFSALIALPALGRSMERVLQAVGQSGKPPFGPLKVKGLAIVWLSAVRVWLEDKSEDLGPTMKALDTGLGHAEELANTFLKPLSAKGPS